MSDKVRQFILESDDREFKYCWLTDSLDLKVGDRIILEDIPGKWWTIREVYLTVKELDHVKCKERPKSDTELFTFDWVPM